MKKSTFTFGPSFAGIIILVIGILPLTPAICLSQSLENVKTKEQAEDFIITYFKFNRRLKYDKFTIYNQDTVDYDVFKFGDYNHDNLKDLLVYGKAEVTSSSRFTEIEIVIFLGGKKGSASRATFPYTFFRNWFTYIEPFPRVISIDNKDYVQLKYDIHDDRAKTKESFQDTVFVLNSHVIPYNKHPSNKEISSIEFKSDHCYGTCPVFELAINSDKEVEYTGIDHVDKKGKYALRMNNKDWEFLTTLIKNIRLEELNAEYYAKGTDQQTGYLTVHFKDGSKKIIQDYGLHGTLGLSILFAFFFELRLF